MNVLVVGAGSMGEWFARTLRDHSDASVAFTDTDSAAARRAAEAVGGRAVPTDTEERFEVVSVAVPMPVASVAIEEYAPLATDAVVDVTGSMTDPLAAMAETVPDRQRASLHPLFAPANAPGNVAAVTPAGGAAVEAVLDALGAAGNDVFETTSAEHDAAMESVQAAAHAAVLAYAMAAEEVPERFHTPVSAGLQSLVEQVLGGEAHVYADIQAAFDGADAVAEAARELADADHDAFVDLYDELP
ncbi:prephenate dehydrogenase/arogenate dehydrogenase family protein [Haloarcula onubensis]|uniref:Prephenate dehydrogenase/arogenate dehydrogenase family protein n=1 Tax=Haloarcula onubensis TaxID=2950539 RepID=A0ABU2FR84_9EURY|nr:prephenate dehydrogenase/arogenate dehydrogenase family protein [Halomicroarcula sp. S3CR25-11]MDS0283272.1 prephenate dehydrogenase/arogenate dehydrogenase family protein [Halomicroarcula sp. S3CR25-11]